jgi:hypothetical protein
MENRDMNDRLFYFAGGDRGEWSVRQQLTKSGEPLASVGHVSVANALQTPYRAQWILHGVTSNERYVERKEKDQLVARQQGLGRTDSTYAALIPIRKNPQWWDTSQDERRSIFEEQSRHIATGMEYLPAIARKLYHCRDLEVRQPFDFLTWFEYAPESESRFDDMLAELRGSIEWRYIDREIDIRLQRSAA